MKRSRSGGDSCISDASSVDASLSSGSSVSEEENEVSYNVLLVGPLAQLQVEDEGNSGTDCETTWSSTWSSDTGGSLSAYSTSSLFNNSKETDNSVSS